MRPFTALALVGSVVLAACTPQDVDKVTDTGFDFAFDLDGDGFGAPADCDDGDSAVNPLARDVAGDGLDVDCDGVDGIDRDRDGVASLGSGGTDCDDESPARAPGQADVGVDGIDQDCSGVDGPDADGDGAASQLAGGTDCDDADASVRPGVTDDVADGVDQDCSGLDGDDATPVVTDVDGDGYDSAALGGVDCDDANAAVNPGATDLAGDSSDQNCDGLDGFDGDQDGVASGWSGGLDCDDTTADVRPGGEDASTDGIDQDCSGVDGPDADGDGYAAAATGGTDCDDTAAGVNLAGVDASFDGVDDDCDGQDGSDAPLVVEDVDGDGFRDVLYGGDDCDDWNAGVNPVVTDLVGDLLDQNCDGVDGQDGDGDGSAAGWSGGDDCDDADPLVNPSGMDTTVDGTDQDCSGLDGSADAPPVLDVDGDGFVAVALGGDDCDDTDATVNLAVFDRAGDGVDGNCDGVDGHDEDHDGVAAWWSLGTDCDDADGAIKPGAADLSVDNVDQDCDGFDGLDVDHDGEAAAFVGTVAAGGRDCDDADARINTRADDLSVDGTDQDCDGVDGNDAPPPRDDDRDGFVATSDGGDDCDDANAARNPVATDIVGDGVDQDCDGIDGRDEDRDGVASRETGGIDCDDRAPAFNPGAPDTAGNFLDENCDGVDGVDADDDGYALGAGDCDDANSVVHFGANDLVSTSADENCDGVNGVDGDGDGVASVASGGTDCDDLLATVNPGETDLTVDGTDQDCSGVDGIDDDGDGHASITSGGRDCDDTVATGRGIHPGAADTSLDGIDQDCDGVDASDANRDVDGDGFVSVTFPGGTDCDDANPALNPAATDLVGDDRDQNCDGIDGYDGDQDGFAASWSGGTDCDDDASDDMAGHVPAASVHPGTVSSVQPDPAGDGTDQDCDGVDGIDDDGDGYASAASGGVDCDDTDASIHPGVTDGATAGDQDCDGLVDEDVVRDLDGDGYDSVLLGGTDCNDRNAAVNPVATDLVGDTFDQNCDGVDGYDGDRDGVAAPWSGGDDCNDLLATVRPGLTTDTTVDGVDQDCDGVDGIDADDDGFAAGLGRDCDDADARVNPAATDLADGVDDDCDGVDGNDAPPPADDDRDGFVDAAEGGEDCDDHNGAVNPYATDIVGDGRDQNCDGMDGTDADGDGQASVLSGGIDCMDTDSTVFVGAAGNEFTVNQANGALLPACTRDEDGDGWGDDALTVPGYFVLTAGHEVGTFTGSDCDDSRADVAPDLYDVDGSDGVDSNCDGRDTDDNDGDGAVDIDAGGADCQDTDAQIVPDALAPHLCGYDVDGDGQVGVVVDVTDVGQATGTGTGTGTGSPGDVITSCFVDGTAGDACIEFRNDSTSMAWCADLPPEIGATTFAMAPCPEDGRAEGSCAIDADASSSDFFTSDVTMYNYGEVDPVNAAANCVANMLGTWTGPGGGGTVPTTGSDCDDENMAVYTGSLPLEGADVCAHDFDGDGYGWDEDGGTDCVEYFADGDPFNRAFIDARFEYRYPMYTDSQSGPLEISRDLAARIHPGGAAEEPALCTIDLDEDGYGATWGATYVSIEPGMGEAFNDLNGNGTRDGTEPFSDANGNGTWDPLVVTATFNFFSFDKGMDCDDDDASTNPDGIDLTVDGVNQDCLGVDGVDTDGDGVASLASGGADCDDANAGISPLRTEVCDGGVDNDCNAVTIETADGDRDGYSVCTGDCAEGDPSVRPGWLPLENDPTLCALDRDHDGWGDAAQGGSDCNDNDPTLHPDRTDPTVCGRDIDMDGYVGEGASGTDCDDNDPMAAHRDLVTQACGMDMDGDGYVALAMNGSDCNDMQDYTHPGAAQFEPTLCAADEDGDGWASALDGGSDCVDVRNYATSVFDGAGYPFYVADGADIYPGAAYNEPTLCAADLDGDGYGESRPAIDGGFDPGTDCDDTLSTLGTNLDDADCDAQPDSGCSVELSLRLDGQPLLSQAFTLRGPLPVEVLAQLRTSGTGGLNGTRFDNFDVPAVGTPQVYGWSTFDLRSPPEWSYYSDLGDEGTAIEGGYGVANAMMNTFQYEEPLPTRDGLVPDVQVMWGADTEAVGILLANADATQAAMPVFYGSLCAAGACGVSYPVVSVGVQYMDAGELRVLNVTAPTPSGMDPRLIYNYLSLSMTPSAACLDTDGDGQDAAAFGGTDCDDNDPAVSHGPANELPGVCGADQDGDGYASLADGGRDCNDFNPTRHPYAGDTYGDGVDADCDGMDCEAGWSDGAYFAACQGNGTWSESGAACSAGGYDGLASVRSMTEQQRVAQVVSDAGFGFAWLGLNDVQRPGTYVWTDGASVAYTNWSGGEPSNTSGSGGDESCAVMQSNLGYAWNDAMCSLRTLDAFVCSDHGPWPTAALGSQPWAPADSCADVLASQPTAQNGLYWIDPNGSGPVQLYCDMSAGGWTLVANIYDSPADDAPNATHYVSSGWQQTGDGTWSAMPSRVDRDASGYGSAAVGLSFVSSLHFGSNQAHLKMCFVHRDGYDTECRSSADGSLTLTMYATGNPRLTAYYGDVLAYTYGRLAGLAGSSDSYDVSTYIEAGYAIMKTPGVSDDHMFGGPDARITDKYNPACPSSDGVWSMAGAGQSYKPFLTGYDELSTGYYDCFQSTDNPSLSSYGFRLYVGP